MDQRLTRFEQENAVNPEPAQAEFRLDAGFGTHENLALLIEMGYEVYTKPHSHQVIAYLRRQVNDPTHWVRVGANAELITWSGMRLKGCPYPLDVALEQFHTGKTLKQSALVHFGADPVTENLPAWFEHYNGRQVIEAGIKEGKGLFQMHHLKVRSTAGLAIQEEFAAFGANLVRWAAEWLHDTNREAPAPFNWPQPNVKQMVRIGANTSAWVTWQPGGCLLMFTDPSAFAGTRLVIQDSLAIQLALPLFESCVFSPI